MTFSDFEKFVLSYECFKNHDVSYIDYDGNQHYLEQDNHITYQAQVCMLIMDRLTIKVEQYEKVIQLDDHTTAHLFYNQENGPSFGIHTDPITVLIECLDGEKVLEIENEVVTLRSGNTVSIPANKEHKALNYKKALIISYGINDTETLNSIRKNDGDLQP